MISAVSLVVLCLASAICGRLLLTREQAQRTVLVRFPALLLVIAATIVLAFGFAVFAAVCFIGGSFFGVATWCWPACKATSSGMFDAFCGPIVRGTWE